jgi:hypothetical protein
VESGQYEPIHERGGSNLNGNHLHDDYRIMCGRGSGMWILMVAAYSVYSTAMYETSFDV